MQLNHPSKHVLYFIDYLEQTGRHKPADGVQEDLLIKGYVVDPDARSPNHLAAAAPWPRGQGNGFAARVS